MHVESLDNPCVFTCVHRALSGKPDVKTTFLSFDVKFTRLGFENAC